MSRRSTWSAISPRNAAEQINEFAAFGTSMRFHPFFDDSVDAVISRNFEFLTSTLEAEAVKAWLASGKKFFVGLGSDKYGGQYMPDTACRAPGLEAAFPSRLFPDGSKDRHMAMAGIFGVQRVVTRQGKEDAFPVVLWQTLHHLAQKCTGTVFGYGYDEIGLAYTLKYLTEKNALLVANSLNSTHLPRGGLVPATSLDVRQEIVGIVAEGRYLLTETNVYALPLFKDNMDLFEQGFLVIDQTPSWMREVADWIGRQGDRFKEWCDVPEDFDQCISNVRDIFEVQRTCVPLCFRVANDVYSFIKKATEPQSNDVAENLKVQLYKLRIQRSFVDFFFADKRSRHDQIVSLGDEMGSIKAQTDFNPKLWNHALLSVALQSDAFYPGWTLKDKDGKLFKKGELNMVKDLM